MPGFLGSLAGLRGAPLAPPNLFPSVVALTARYDADADPLASIASWTDQSGNNYHQQAALANRPVNTASQLNGHNAVVFDGVSSFMQATFPSAQPTHIWLVMRQDAHTASHYILDGVTNNSAALYQAVTSGTLRTYAGAFGPTNVAPLGVFHLVEVVFNGVASSITIDNGTPVVGDSGVSSANGLTLGALANGGRPAAISIADVVVMSAAPSVSERAAMLTYVNNKAGWAL